MYSLSTGGGEGEGETNPGIVGGEGGLEQYMNQVVAVWPLGLMQPRPCSVIHQVPPRSLSGLVQPL